MIPIPHSLDAVQPGDTVRVIDVATMALRFNAYVLRANSRCLWVVPTDRLGAGTRPMRYSRRTGRRWGSAAYFSGTRLVSVATSVGA